MKRFTAASVAAATALSLVAAPAMAAETKSSSEVSDLEAVGYVVGSLFAEEITPGSGVTSSVKNILEDYEKGDDLSVLDSSVRNDAAKGYKLGTTFDILLGTGIAALVLALLGGAAAYQGLIPGVQLP